MPGKEKHPYFTQDGADRENHSNQHLANMRDGAWAGFKYFDIRTCSEIRISARGSAMGKILVQSKRGGEVLGTIQLHPSADWQEFSGEFHIDPGIHALYFTYQGTGYVDWLWFELY